MARPLLRIAAVAALPGAMDPDAAAPEAGARAPGSRAGPEGPEADQTRGRSRPYE